MEIVVNDRYVLRSNKMRLACSSTFFNNLISSQFRQQNDGVIKLNVPNNNVVLFQAILNFIMLGMLIVPQSMSYQSWIELY